MGRKFEDFLKEANRRANKTNREDYVFTINDRKITVPAPDAQTFLALPRAKEGDILGQLNILFSNSQSDFSFFLDSLEGQPVEVLKVFMEDMYDFWNTEVPSPGNSSK